MDKATQELLDSYVAKIKALEDSAPRIELNNLQKQYSLLNATTGKLCDDNFTLKERNKELEDDIRLLNQIKDENQELIEILNYKVKKFKKKSKLFKKIIMFLISREVVMTDATLIYSNKSS